MGNYEDFALRFTALLDGRLGLPGGATFEPADEFVDSEIHEDVEFAMSLWPEEFSEESKAQRDVRARLRTKLESTTTGLKRVKTAGESISGLVNLLTASRWRLIQTAVGIVLVLILLQIFQVPVWASLQRFVGYGYAPRAGFVPLEGTMMLPRAVVLDLEGEDIEIQQIVVRDSTLEMWIASDGELTTPSIAEITLPDDERPELVDGYQTEGSGQKVLSYWRYRGQFETPSWLELRLSRYPVQWIPLQRASDVLTPVRDLRVCDSHAGISVCAVALTGDRDLTCSLIEINLEEANLVDGLPNLVADPLEPGSAVTIISSAGDGSVRVQPGLQARARALQVSGVQGLFLQQLCFQDRLTGGDIRLQIPAVEVTIPMINQIRVPVHLPDEGWVDLDERLQWPNAEIAIQQGRAFPGEGGVRVLRVLGTQVFQGSDAIITGFTPQVLGDGRIVQIGSSHDPAHGLHTIDIWLSGDRSDATSEEILVEIRNPHLTFLGPFELVIEGKDE